MGGFIPEGVQTDAGKTVSLGDTIESIPELVGRWVSDLLGQCFPIEALLIFGAG